jgi:hypothetical protein
MYSDFSRQLPVADNRMVMVVLLENAASPSMQPLHLIRRIGLPAMDQLADGVRGLWEEQRMDMVVHDDPGEEQVAFWMEALDSFSDQGTLSGR